jgi:hypothetical protein
LSFKNGNKAKFKKILINSLESLFYIKKIQKNDFSFNKNLSTSMFNILESLVVNNNFLFSFCINKIDKSKRKNLKNKKNKYIVL